MPIYEYECSSCQHSFELIQKISDAPVKQCPQCYADTAVRLVSAAGFQLKGTGWYATDFKNKAAPANKQETAKQPDKAADNKTAETTKKETATITQGEKN